MNRLTRFARNAGVQGCVFTGIVAIFSAFAMIRDFRAGHWIVTLPLLVAAVVLTYAIRGFLIDNISVVRVIMNLVAVAGVAAAILLPRPAGPEPLWMRAVIVAVLGTYLGCYFWMLSDDRIAVL